MHLTRGGCAPTALWRAKGRPLAIADGSALTFVGLVGLAAWLGWMITTGVRLIRQ